MFSLSGQPRASEIGRMEAQYLDGCSFFGECQKSDSIPIYLAIHLSIHTHIHTGWILFSVSSGADVKRNGS